MEGWIDLSIKTSKERYETDEKCVCERGEGEIVCVYFGERVKEKRD
jgi:hypothetical protein